MARFLHMLNEQGGDSLAQNFLFFTLLTSKLANLWEKEAKKSSGDGTRDVALVP